MTDLKLIKQIENELGLTLKQVPELEWNSQGYTLSQTGQVTGLGLFSCDLAKLERILSSLSGLNSLNYLDLSGNHLSDLTPLRSLSGLTGLVLSNNHLSNLTPLSSLNGLTLLVLSGNRISDLTPLSSLSGLTLLALNGNHLSDLTPLRSLSGLTYLYLDNNTYISNLMPLASLSSLTHLGLSGNVISDLTPLSGLSGLTGLVLSNNRLSDLTPLSSLSGLTQLGLSGNRISDLTPLCGLSGLTQLGLSDNCISDLTHLADLSGLTELDLSHNGLSDLTLLAGLSGLTQLVLSHNGLSDLTLLAGLSGLTQLVLSGNRISDLTPLRGLSDLIHLYLNANQVNDLTPLVGLSNLTHLDLSSNRISDLTPLRGLSRLTQLNLGSNPLETLPSWIVEFDLEIEWAVLLQKDGYIIFFNNSLVSPPPEIVQQGKKAVKNYFEQLQAQAHDYLFEAKLLIVGEPGAGKTSLARKLADPHCPLPVENETTRGIEVAPYEFPLPVAALSGLPQPMELAGRSFRVNLWDFGGQDIYKATHRFFLSKRALYVLVADSRNEDTDFNYWLHIVELFGSDSPLLIVLNEKHGRQRHLDLTAIRGRFSNIVEVLTVDLAAADLTRLNKLAAAIQYQAARLPHIGSPVPARWTAIREKLETDGRNTITLQDYLGLCRTQSLTRTQDALVLSQYFHDIGVFLHFQDDDVLNHTLFLKPNWATYAVYKILDHELLNRNRGRFNKDEASIIWHEDEYQLVRGELLRLMQKFFLTYEIGQTGQYIVPERLPDDQPAYPWSEQDNLFLRYQYDFFMPRGLLSQLIVHMHRYICDHNLVWRRGVVLGRDNTTAEIIESYENRTIKIRLGGQHRRDFITLISEQIDAINGQYEKMKVEKLIPCNCQACKSADEPFFYRYQDLKGRIERGKPDVECGRSYNMVNVRSLIDEVINEALLSRGDKAVMPLQKDNREHLSDTYTFPTAAPPPSDTGLALIMKGGGVKGLAYVGALKELEEHYRFNWFVGTSAGAIAAALLAVGYTTSELEEILSKKNFKDFLDSSIYQLPSNLYFYKGLYKAYTFTSWIRNLVAEKLDSPVPVLLKDLPHRVTIYASTPGKKALVFDSHNPETANIPVAHAVRCSMAIPYFFTPEYRDGARVVDGGIQNNFPVEALLQNYPGIDFIGLYLGPEIDEGEDKEPLVLLDLFSVVVDADDREVLREYRENTIIIDPRPIGTVDFDLDDEEKEFLLNAGRVAARKFLLKQGKLTDNGELNAEKEKHKQVREDLIQKRKKRRRKRNMLVLAILLLTILAVIAIILAVIAIIMFTSP